MNKLLFENNVSNSKFNNLHPDDLKSKIHTSVQTEMDKIMAIYEETFLGKIE
jgi:hypothetical protein